MHAQDSPAQRASWNEPILPFHIVGNIYHVGVQGITAFLIATPDGLILLDGGFPETAPLIAKNVSSLGFQMKDVKYMLNSHAHFDHCGGLPELKRLSGAKLVASAGDSIQSGGSAKLRCPPSGDSRIPADSSFLSPDVDRIIRDNENVELGGVKLVANLTPGHTRGCTTWTMKASDGNKTFNVVFYCSTTVAGNRLVNNSDYPEIVSDFEKTFAKLKRLPCDVFLAPHGSFFNRDEKIELLQAGRKDAFIDSKEMKTYVVQSQQSFEEELSRQRAQRK